MRQILNFSALTLALAVGAILSSSSHAAPLLSFGQASNADTIVGTRSGSSTSLNATNAMVSITQLDGPIGTPLPAFLTFDFDSVAAATLVDGHLFQIFGGNFCITAGTNCTGNNYLSGTLANMAFVGVNAAFGLVASTPPDSDVSFTSSVIPAFDLGSDRGVGFSFADVSPLLHINNSTVDSFTSTVSGTFSATPVPAPEPISLSLLGVGLIGLGATRYFRTKAR